MIDGGEIIDIDDLIFYKELEVLLKEMDNVEKQIQVYENPEKRISSFMNPVLLAGAGATTLALVLSAPMVAIGSGICTFVYYIKGYII